MSKCENKFKEIYKKEPQSVAFCPYRICPIGAHSDHQLGVCSGFAIDKGIRIAFAPKQNGIVELCSLQFNKRAQWHVRAVPEKKCGDWADYLRGATVELSKYYPNLSVGISGVIDGDLKIGGLSSSAAVTFSFLKALCTVNGIHLEDKDAINIAKDAENRYVGVQCGKLDQSCETLSRSGHLLFIDTLDDSHENIACPGSAKPFAFAIIFSGLERALAGSAYNMRVDECRSAAYALKAFAGMEYGKFEECNMREVPEDTYLELKDRLPQPWRMRAEHWYGEQRRVRLGVEAWRKGDIEEFGRLCSESGRSSIENWQAGSPELIALYEIIRSTEGVYGGRFSGAGFKGNCIALIDPARMESIERQIRDAYCKKFPALADKFNFTICKSVDGIKI